MKPPGFPIFYYPVQSRCLSIAQFRSRSVKPSPLCLQEGPKSGHCVRSEKGQQLTCDSEISLATFVAILLPSMRLIGLSRSPVDSAPSARRCTHNATECPVECRFRFI